jgi:hypothetical protein
LTLGPKFDLHPDVIWKKYVLLATILVQGSISTILPSEDCAEIWPDIQILLSNGEALVNVDTLHFSLSDGPQSIPSLKIPFIS